MCFTSKPVETIEVDESEAIVGYRNYYIREGRLWPINYDAVPAEKVAEAKCRDAVILTRSHGSDRSAPQQDCACGIYVCAEPDSRYLTSNAGNVRARVRIWGRIVRHGSDGYRAQFCQPLALAPTPGCRDPKCPVCAATHSPEQHQQVTAFYGAEWVSDVKALEVPA